jgi:hypothetical protein
MRFALIILGNLLVFLSAFGLGGFLRPLFPRSFSKLDRLAMVPLAGFGLQGLLLFLVGLVRFTPAVILTVLLPGALLGIRCLFQETRGAAFSSAIAGIPLIPGGVIAVVLAVTFLGGFAEPVGDDKYDAIYYHYLGPKVWLRDGIVRPVLDESLTAFPATVEIQSAPLLLLGGDAAPELFSVIGFVLMILVVATTAIRCGLDPPDVWWTIALVSAMPAVYRGFFGGMIDVIYAAFLIAAARFAFDAKCPTDYALAGLFCGFAMGTKYPGLVATTLLIVCVFVWPVPPTRRFSKTMFKHLGAVGVAGSLIAAPWYLRNWLLFGSPLYPPPPLFSKIFHIHYFPPGAIVHFHDMMLMVGRGMGQDPVHLLVLPFNLTFHAANFEGGAGGIGLVPLAFLPFCFRALRRDSFSKALGLFGVLMTLAWFYTLQESRYLIQVYLLAGIFGVAGWRYVRQEGPRLTRALSTMTVAVSLLYGLFMIVTGRANDIRASVSASLAERRNQAQIPFFESFRFLNTEPSVGKVLVLDPVVPTFYLNRDYLKPLGRWGEQSLPGVTAPLDALSVAAGHDISHVLDVQTSKFGFQVPENTKSLVLIFEEKGQRIYRVSPRR